MNDATSSISISFLDQSCDYHYHCHLLCCLLTPFPCHQHHRHLPWHRPPPPNHHHHPCHRHPRLPLGSCLPYLYPFLPCYPCLYPVILCRKRQYENYTMDPATDGVSRRKPLRTKKGKESFKVLVDECKSRQILTTKTAGKSMHLCKLCTA